ncbi:toll/interleukin-1 receptor domain-containing protein [Sorangium sp. So ce1078]|uniref:toll/interleukin-1 receptor domain-containing protein n=1 Tax=Sorangium sp. So ce1078 TaxID=3133329 RepID=UPI003F602C73
MGLIGATSESGRGRGRRGGARGGGLIAQWRDRQIDPGEDWKESISEHLDRASIVLLLVNPDFIASDCCYDVEVTRALNRLARKEALVIPVIVRPCDWDAAPFARFQALPRDATPITRWADRDEAWLDLACGLRAAIAKLMARSM